MKICKIFFLYLLTALSSILHSNEKAYFQSISSVTQVPNLTTSSFILSDPGSANPIKNFTFTETSDKSIDKIVCEVSGLYLICTSIQPAVLAPRIRGYLDCWYELNGIPIPASNSRQYVNQDSKISLMTNTFLLELKKGDVFANKFIASGPDIGTICIKNLLNGEPNILSFGITILKIY